ncbi:hypothetical protein ACO22_07101 [Paracoccidioides brasiliensis]|uniref:Uncharacterized protein n=1 Tax=Paracoccidioides brasiliensis TaxID=121759 RepID=A0A1D2J5K7_PARBR|nr:hypothetical protein ACO22_07101 [Paracoccidioides brasiliensis]
MAATGPTGSPRRKIPKLDLAQISLNLQDRLGLAKVRYERTHRRRIEPLQPLQQVAISGPSEREVISDSSSEICDNNRYETPFSSSPLPTPILSEELPRSSRSKHAAMFFPSSLDTNGGGSRKRGLSSPTTEQPSKALRISSWKATNRLPQSSPILNCQSTAYQNNFLSHHKRHSIAVNESMQQPFSSSMISSSPPRTPPPKRNRTVARIDKDIEKENGENGENGVDLLLYLANSPTPANYRGSGKLNSILDFPPSTPPSQHAALLPSLTTTPGGGVTANFGSPAQQFNFADFVNVTPSPAQLPWGGRTPGTLSSRTPRPSKELRKRLNFDGLIPPSAGSPSMMTTTTREKRVGGGVPLQLGEELRP